MPTTFGGWKAQDYFGSSIGINSCQLSPICQCCNPKNAPKFDQDELNDRMYEPLRTQRRLNARLAKKCKVNKRKVCSDYSPPAMKISSPSSYFGFKWRQRKGGDGSCIFKYSIHCG